MLLRRFLDDRFSPGPGAIRIPIAGLVQQYKDAYTKIKQSGKQITYRFYRLDPEDFVVVHFKVPSRSVNNVEYDVCIALIPKNTRTNNFMDCHVRFFCNAPSFTYSGTAYLFHSLPDPDLGPGGFEVDRFGKQVPVNRITLFESLLDDNAFTQPPVQRNPYQIPMLFDNVIGAAIIELTTKVPYYRAMQSATKITQDALFRHIKTFGQMGKSRAKEVNKQKKELKRAAEFAKDIKSGALKSTAKNSTGVGKAVRKVQPVKARKATNSTGVRKVQPNKGKK